MIPNATTFLTVGITVALTLILHRIYEPNVWVGVSMAIGVATILVTGHALLLRFSRKS